MLSENDTHATVKTEIIIERFLVRARQIQEQPQPELTHLLPPVSFSFSMATPRLPPGSTADANTCLYVKNDHAAF